jgi:hypothetical protein
MSRTRRLIAVVVFVAVCSLALWVVNAIGGPPIESVRLKRTTGCTFIVETRADDTQVAYHAADCEKCALERLK